MTKINVTKNLKFDFRMAKNIVGKGENAGYQHFSPFPTMFSKSFLLRVAKSPDFDVKGYSTCSPFNRFPNKPWFLSVCSKSLWKTLWEEEKLLITSNFSFSDRIFNHFKELSAIFIKF